MSKILLITQTHAGQRLDNFLFTHMKGVPKSRIYRAIRGGEFRINGGRVTAGYRLVEGDKIRIPPLRIEERENTGNPPKHLIEQLESRILYEDDSILAINKPSGIPVHGGSEISWGLIEALRCARPEAKMLELIHRLDRETSGCLLIAKRRSSLLEWHELLLNRKVNKEYFLLVRGAWPADKKTVKLALRKNTLKSGERMVIVDPDGKAAETRFKIEQCFKDFTLLSAKLITGRTHQLRVHAAASGHPIAGDQKYGDPEFNQHVKQLGLKRLFLHCSAMSRRHPTTEGFQGINAPLDLDLELILK